MGGGVRGGGGGSKLNKYVCFKTVWCLFYTTGLSNISNVNVNAVLIYFRYTSHTTLYIHLCYHLVYMYGDKQGLAPNGIRSR